MSRPTAIVYVDGFNLYRRCLDTTPYKWLNLQVLSELLLKDYDVIKVNYFTALVKNQPHDQQAPQRQQTYLRALRTLPTVEIHLGQFRVDKRWMPIHPLTIDEKGRPELVRVRKAEEKGSDVNLTTQLLVDGFREAADAFVVVSNDSDLVAPLRLLRSEFGRTIGLISPVAQPSQQLLSTRPQLIRTVREGALKVSQFDDVLADSIGPIRRPDSW